MFINSKNNFHSITLFALSLNTQNMCDRFAMCDFTLFPECCLWAHWMCRVWAKAMEGRVGAGHDANLWEGCWINLRKIGPLSDQGMNHGKRWLEEAALGCLPFPLCVAVICSGWTNRVLPGSMFSSPHTQHIPPETGGGDSELCVYTNRSVTMANHAKPDSHDVTWATWGGINNTSSRS